MIKHYFILTEKRQKWIWLHTLILVALVSSTDMQAQQWETVGNTSIISASGSSFNNLVIDSNGKYYVSYYDLLVSKASVQKYDGISWSYLGGDAGITEGMATYSSLSIDNTDTVYYTNQLGWPGSGLEVRQFDGISWTQLSNATTSPVNYQASAVSETGTLFTYSNDGSGTVRRNSGDSWQQVGNSGFSSGATFAEMVIGSNNMVYTCNVSGSNVQVYENNITSDVSDNWNLTGGEAVSTFASGSEQYTSDIAIDAANNLYVAFVSNSAGGQKLNVKKYNGSSWIQLGPSNFSTGKVQHVAIAVSALGKVFVVGSRFEDDNYLRNTAYSYSESSDTWDLLGSDFISEGEATYNDLVFDNIGNYLVLAYSESGTKVKRIAIQEETVPDCSNTDPGTTTGNTGCITLNYNGQETSYTTVRGGDGNIWLQQNLGSSQIATALDDENSYGDLFQWGRWDDGHQKRTSETISQLPDPNNPIGIGNGLSGFIISSPAWWSTNSLTDKWSAPNVESVDKINGCDPCRAALGQGWKLPTQEDWAGLVEAENITNPTSAFASNLMLSATGYRSSTNGDFTFVGQRGYYWSSTTSTTGAKYLYIGSTIANPAAGAPRGQGAAIRCVKLAQLQVASVEISVQNNAEPTIVTENGILQLQAIVNPATANQAVLWSITSGSEFVTIDENGLITAMANGTATVKATSVEDTTKYGELDIVVNIASSQDCEPISELYENFDDYSCCEMGVVPACWESIILGGASQIISSTQPASGTSQIYQFGYGAGKISIVVLPQFSNINDGTHQLRFKVKANGGPGVLDLGYITDNNDATTFEVIESLTINNSNYNSNDAERTLTVPTTVPDDARLAIRNPGTTWAGMYWDDVYWEPVAVASVILTTQNNVAAEITSENGTLQLVATVNPAGVNQDVIWSVVSGSEFAAVDANGTVTALANGLITIRATAVADPTKFDDMQVIINYEEVVEIESVVVTTQNGVPAEITLENGTLQLVATVNPSGANQDVIWSIVSGNEFASIDENGSVSAIQNGTITIQAVSIEDNTVSDTIDITITGQVIPVETIEIIVDNNAEPVITVSGGTLQLHAVVLPETAAQDVAWSIIDGEAFASIDENGSVSAIQNGTITVQAVSIEDNTVSDTIEISITGQVIPVETIEIIVDNDAEPVITVSGGTLQLHAVVLPETAAQDVIWSIIDGEAFASIDENGSVSAIQNGTITIQAVSIEDNTVSDTIDITITGQVIPVETIEIIVDNNAEPVITVSGGTLQLHAVVLPETAAQDVAWSIIDGEAFASIDENGSVSAIQNGTITVQAVSIEDNTVSDTIEISITGQVIPVETIEIIVDNDAEPVITVSGGTLQLHAVVLPETAAQDVIWSIIDGEAFASIDENGSVSAIQNGTITVQAVSIEDNTVSDTIEISITGQVIPVETIEIIVDNDAEPVITVSGGTLQLHAVVLPETAVQDVIWSIIDGETYASIDENGLVTAIGNGTVTIDAKSIENTALSDTIEIIVSGQTLGIVDFDKFNLSIHPNPARDILFIESDAEVEEVIIYSLMGQQVLQSVTKTINIQNFANGMYMVHITFIDGYSVTKKIIKK